jgi:hypothetical protein
MPEANTIELIQVRVFFHPIIQQTEMACVIGVHWGAAVRSNKTILKLCQNQLEGRDSIHETIPWGPRPKAESSNSYFPLSSLDLGAWAIRETEFALKDSHMGVLQGSVTGCRQL